MIYSEKVLDHFKNPRNFGEMKNPDAIGKVGNVVCGDVMWVYIKVKDRNIIEDIKFQTFGCTSAIASSSVITEMAKGKTFECALKITKDDIVKELDGLPPVKIHCSILANDALAEAIYEYSVKNNLPISEDLELRHLKNKKKREIANEH